MWAALDPGGTPSPMLIENWSGHHWYVVLYRAVSFIHMHSESTSFARDLLDLHSGDLDKTHAMDRLAIASVLSQYNGSSVVEAIWIGRLTVAKHP